MWTWKLLYDIRYQFYNQALRAAIRIHNSSKCNQLYNMGKSFGYNEHTNAIKTQTGYYDSHIAGAQLSLSDFSIGWHLN